MKKLFFGGIVALIALVGVVMLYGVLKGKTNASGKPSDSIQKPVSPAEDVGAIFSKDPAIPFQFSTGDLGGKIIQRATSPAKDADYILSNYKACGPKYRPSSYFPETAKTLRKLPETTFSLGKFQIVLIPNLLGHKNFPALQEDFFACDGAVGVLVPVAMNDSWDVFTRSCASDDEGCKQASKIISATVRLK